MCLKQSLVLIICPAVLVSSDLCRDLQWHASKPTGKTLQLTLSFLFFFLTAVWETTKAGKHKKNQLIYRSKCYDAANSCLLFVE